MIIYNMIKDNKSLKPAQVISTSPELPFLLYFLKFRQQRKEKRGKEESVRNE